MRRREVVLLEFRTPQHPSTGSNNWGGASPLLARNIPKEALDQSYLRLNTVRDRDQIFPTTATTIGDEILASAPIKTIGEEIFSSSKNESRSNRRGKGLLRRLKWRPHKRSSTTATLGLNSGWFLRWDSKKRWPNGWC